MNSKAVIFLLGEFSMSSAFAAGNLLKINCVTATGEKMVSAVVDMETGEKNKFVHYAFGKATSSYMSHVETDPDATTDGNTIEIYGQAQDGSGSSSAKLGIKDINSIDGVIVGTGKLEAAENETQIEHNLLKCVIKK